MESSAFAAIHGPLEWIHQPRGNPSILRMLSKSIYPGSKQPLRQIFEMEGTGKCFVDVSREGEEDYDIVHYNERETITARRKPRGDKTLKYFF